MGFGKRSFLSNEEIVGIALEVGLDESHFIISYQLYKLFSFLSYLMITVAQTVYPNCYLNSMGYLVN